MKIGELAKKTGAKVETIRFYEQAGLLEAPARTAANYRCYDEAHLRRLSFIRRSRELGISLGNARELLSLADNVTQSCSAVDDIARNHLGDIENKIIDLQNMRAELQRVLATCRTGSVGDCKIIETLSQCRA